MRKYLYLFLLILIPYVLQAQWAKSIGGTAADYGRSIAVDNNGNVFVAGYFQGTVDFDPGAGTTSITATGSFNAFLAKYSSDGSLIWVNTIPALSGSYGYGTAVDGSGNAYIIGTFQGTVDFDPGAGTTELTSNGSSDVFLVKFASDGSFNWVVGFGSANGEAGYGVAVDASNNVYVTGSFQSTVDFDPGAGTANLTSDGSDEIFLAKYSSTGSYMWADKIGGTSADCGNFVYVDASSNIYLTGYFNGTADFDPGAGTTNLTSVGSSDIFFAKYSSDGSFVWADGVGGIGADYGRSIIADNSGNVYVTGSYQGTADFDPGAGTTSYTSAGGNDLYVGKYASDGSLVWVNSIGGTLNDYGYGIGLDGSNNVYLAGYYQGTVDFDPGAGTTSYTSAGGYDVYFAKFTSSGSLTYAKSFGSSSSDLLNGCSVKSNCVYLTGVFQNSADFDTGTGTSTLTSAGGYDIFFAKYDATTGELPVELASFTVKENNGSIVLSWVTDTEVNNYGFEIEKTFTPFQVTEDGNGDGWTKIGFIPGSGTSNSQKNYTFTDTDVHAGLYKYRLKQIDNDGRYEYSNISEATVTTGNMSYSLHQNYPNPFNPSTIIDYTLPKESHVVLKLYDILGREVKTLVNTTQSAGTHSYNFTADELNLSAGIYIYRIEADNFGDMKKMLLLK